MLYWCPFIGGHDQAERTAPRRAGRAASVGVPTFLDELIAAGLDPAWLEIPDFGT